MDIGVHALDLLLWWFGECELVSYRDDSQGGLETDCEVHLRFQNGVTGIAELSRTRNLRNSCVIEGDCGTLTVEAECVAIAEIPPVQKSQPQITPVKPTPDQQRIGKAERHARIVGPLARLEAEAVVVLFFP